MAVLKLPVVLEKRAWTPLAVLEQPVVLEKREQLPLAVFWMPVVLETRALQPRAEILAVVQPRTIPATIGVAAVTIPPVVPQQTAFEPFDISTWPAVPQLLAQSAIPAPGRIVLALLPVSQLSVGEKPMASWQEPVGKAT